MKQKLLKFIKTFKIIKDLKAKDGHVLVLNENELNVYKNEQLLRVIEIGGETLSVDGIICVGGKDGLFVLSSGTESTLIVEKTDLNYLIHSNIIQTQNIIQNEVFSMASNGSILAVGLKDSVLIFRISNSLELIHKFNTMKVSSLSWHPTKPILVAGGDHLSVFCIDTMTTLNTIKMECTSVNVLLNGTIVVGDRLGSVSFYDSCSLILLKTIKAHFGDVLTIGGSKECFSGGVDGKISRFMNNDAKRSNNWEMITSVKVQQGDINSLCIDGGTLMSGGLDGMVNSSDFNMKNKSQFGGLNNRDVIHVSDDFCLGQYLKELRLFEINDVGYKQLLRIDLDANIICSAISGSFICCGTVDKVKVFEWKDGQILKLKLQSLVGLIAFKMRILGDLLVIGDKSGKIYVIDFIKDEVIHVFDQHFKRVLKQLDITQCGTFIACSDSKRMITITNLMTKKVVILIGF